MCCSKCKKPYNPDRDIQRFCRFCRTWYHVKCLSAFETESSTRLPKHVELLTKHSRSLHWPYGNVFTNLVQKPIVRGKNSGIVGSGRLLDIAWSIITEIWHDDRDLTMMDWERMEVTEEMLTDWVIDSSNQTYYDCPTCQDKGKEVFL